MTPGRSWTPAEVARLRAALAAGRTPLALARSGELPGRTVAAIRAAAERRGLDWAGPGWTTGEVARLRAALRRTPLRKIAESGEWPGRTPLAIRLQAHRLGYVPRRLIGGGRARQVSVYLPVAMVAWLDRQPGCTRSRLAREAISRMMIG